MDCLFCKIAQKEIDVSMVYEDNELVAFHDIQPQAPTHVLIIPKIHIATLDDTREEHTMLLGRMMACARTLANELGLDEGYRLVMNCKAFGGQSVYHVHLHLLGGRSLGWPPG